MRGHRVERRFGWDTHGLPAELEAMSQLGIKTTDEIRELGIGVQRQVPRLGLPVEHTDEVADYVTRQARWVDFENDYKTLDLTFGSRSSGRSRSSTTRAWPRGLPVLPYCWNDQTPLSNHELRMDEDVYQNRQDPAVTVGCRLTDGPYAGALALIWTTTPWTLTCNLAIMVGADIEYVVVESAGADRPTGAVPSRRRGRRHTPELTGDPRGDVTALIVARVSGTDLVGTHTPRRWGHLEHPNAFRLVTAEFVTTTDGTGLVPPPAPSVRTTRSSPTARASRWSCRSGSTAGSSGDRLRGAARPRRELRVIDHLKFRTRLDADGAPGEVGSITEGTVLLRRETYDHAYPHCWRCRQPLIYGGRVVVRLDDDDPGPHARAQPGDHLGARAHQGQPVRQVAGEHPRLVDLAEPVLGQPDPGVEVRRPGLPRVDVYGSLADLEADFGVPVTDLHRPFVDSLTTQPGRPRPEGERRRCAG